MSRVSWLGKAVDSAAHRHDRNHSKFGLFHIFVAVAAVGGWVGWLTSDSSGASFGSLMKGASFLVLCAVPLILFLLAGPVDKIRDMHDKDLGHQVLSAVALGFTLLLSLVPLIVAYPFAKFSGVPAMRTQLYDLVGFELAGSSLQLAVGAALSVLLYDFLAQLLALRGSSLRDSELRTHFRGVYWVKDVARFGRRFAGGVFTFVPRTIKASVNAPKKFRGARDAQETVSSGGLDDVMSGRVGKQVPLKAPAEHHHRPAVDITHGMTVDPGLAARAQAAMAAVQADSPQIRVVTPEEQGAGSNNPWSSADVEPAPVPGS